MSRAVLAHMRKIRLLLNPGMTLLAVWLIAVGAVPLLGIGSPGVSTIMSITAIAAGVLLLWQR